MTGVDHDPKAIDPGEFGLREISSRKVANLPDKLVVLRDLQGRILWQLSGNSPEQNEQLVINNIQALFLSRYPQFDELFPRDENGRVANDKQDQLRRFIITRLSSRERIRFLVEANAPEKKSTVSAGEANEEIKALLGEVSPANPPAFVRRSFTSVIAKAFNPWGLGLPEIVDLASLPKVDRKTGIYVDRRGVNWATASYYIQSFSVADSTLQQYLEDADFVIGRDRVNREAILFCEPQVNARLGSFLSLPQVDKDTGKYIDETGESWVAAAYLENSFDIPQRNVEVYLRNRKLRFIPGRARNGVRTILYNEEEAVQNIKAYCALPKVDQSSHSYIDEEGESWVTGKYFEGEYRLSYETQRRIFKDTPTRNGRGENGMEVILYRKNEAEEKVRNYLSLPKTNEAKKYKDSQGECWVVENYFRVKYGLSSAITELLKKVPNIVGRSTTGREVTLYNLREGEEAFAIFIALPLVDKVTGKYVDGQGLLWTPIKPLAKSLSVISDGSLASILVSEGVSFISGRDKTGKRVNLYREDEAVKAVAKFLSSPQVDKNTGRYVDPDGIQWVVAKRFSDIYGVSENILPQYLEGTPTIRGRGRSGCFINLYREDCLVEKVGYLLSLPHLDRMGKYTDEQGQCWVGRSYFLTRFVIDGKTINKIFRTCFSRKGLGRNGRETNLYNELEITKLLEEKGYPLRNDLKALNGEVQFDGQITQDDANKELERLTSEE